MSRSRIAHCAVLVTCVGLAACGGDRPGGARDAGAGDGSLAPDAAGADAWVATSELFGACETDSDCPFGPGGEPGVCRRPEDGFRGGFCTHGCTDRSSCWFQGRYHHCEPDGLGWYEYVHDAAPGPRYCQRRCQNNVDCEREGYLCPVGRRYHFPDGDHGFDGACTSFCTSDADCGTGSCDRATGVCGGSPPATTGPGEPCDSHEECSLGCWGHEQYAGGYCSGLCILPDGFGDATFWGGTTLPRGTCVDGEVCIPGTAYYNSSLAGDWGYCFVECGADADCLPGYECLREIETASGARLYDNGWCVPANCLEVGCPDGYVCKELFGGGVACEPE